MFTLSNRLITCVGSGLPTSLNRTCISVIDETENSVSYDTIRNSWLKFRADYPNRTFFLLQPRNFFEGANSDLRVPQEFLDDPKAFGPIYVGRDDGKGGDYTKDWVTTCNLDVIPNLAAVAIFIDNSGSMTTSSVASSYADLVSYLNSRGMLEIVVEENETEDWMTPFNQRLGDELAQIPGEWAS